MLLYRLAEDWFGRQSTRSQQPPFRSGMNPSPFLGVLFHWLGGLAAGSFYVPYRGVRNWSWETSWLVGGVFSWIICPSVLAGCLTEDLAGELSRQSAGTLFWAYFFGLLWGVGGLTFGLAMRFLGLSLGMGVALGYCAAFGTLLPPLLKELVPGIPVAETLSEIATTGAGAVTLGGIALCLIGIAVAAWAGLTKEQALPEAEKKKTIAEFDFRKGFVVASFAGVMSACFAFALTAAAPIGEASLAAGTRPHWTGLPKLVVVLLGGFTTNAVWCLFLNLRNRTAYQYLARTRRAAHAAGNPQGGEPAIGGGVPPGDTASQPGQRIPRLRNYGFAALAGTTWYFQFFFYTIGETQMGAFGFASWTLHMASIIIFSRMWGWIFHEWKGSSRKAHTLIAAGIATLILSTIVIGYGTWLKGQ